MTVMRGYLEVVLIGRRLVQRLTDSRLMDKIASMDKPPKRWAKHAIYKKKFFDLGTGRIVRR